MTIDVEKLRDALRDELGAAAFSGLSAAYGDLIAIESASAEELVDYALSLGIDLSNFEVGRCR